MCSDPFSTSFRLLGRLVHRPHWHPRPPVRLRPGLHRVGRRQRRLPALPRRPPCGDDHPRLQPWRSRRSTTPTRGWKGEPSDEGPGIGRDRRGTSRAARNSLDSRHPLDSPVSWAVIARGASRFARVIAWEAGCSAGFARRPGGLKGDQNLLNCAKCVLTPFRLCRRRI